ncbi:MAG: universal stress protein [Pseudomonadota bacterium]
MYQRILVPIDGSALSKKAVRSAVQLAASLGAELVAMHVVPRYPMSYFDGGIAVSRADVARLEKQWSDRAQELVDDAKEYGSGRGVKVKGLVVQSSAIADAIVRVAAKQKCDLIAMASHGRKGIKRILLGSETQQVLAQGSIPTLVLR